MAKRKSLSTAVPSENDWRTESDMSTLIEAEKIEKDPKRMAAVRKLAKSRLMGLAAIAAEGKDES
ncbi:hypothetical protein LJR074_001961 [Acidovorax sp. LjRoot74]|uniref:hypothetical protein n=1 Tax=Acidovorax sp. LjRoot74 TaxID=3342337 RepID=UPI003ED034A1